MGEIRKFTFCVYGLTLTVHSTIFLDRVEVVRERRRASGVSVVCCGLMAITS